MGPFNNLTCFKDNCIYCILKKHVAGYKVSASDNNSQKTSMLYFVACSYLVHDNSTKACLTYFGGLKPGHTRFSQNKIADLCCSSKTKAEEHKATLCLL